MDKINEPAYLDPGGDPKKFEFQSTKRTLKFEVERRVGMT
jgi:hypothetical protein